MHLNNLTMKIGSCLFSFLVIISSNGMDQKKQNIKLLKACEEFNFAGIEKYKNQGDVNYAVESLSECKAVLTPLNSLCHRVYCNDQDGYPIESYYVARMIKLLLNAGANQTKGRFKNYLPFFDVMHRQEMLSLFFDDAQKRGILSSFVDPQKPIGACFRHLFFERMSVQLLATEGLILAILAKGISGLPIDMATSNTNGYSAGERREYYKNWALARRQSRPDISQENVLIMQFSKQLSSPALYFSE